VSPESAITFFIAIFIFGVTPGPGVFAILARALSAGTGACFPLALGMVISDIAYMVLACYGLSALAEHWNEVFLAVRIAGAIYLCYLGFKIWNTPAPQAQAETATAPGKRFSLLQGFLISASNPKVILFYIAFLPTFIDLTALSHTDIAIAGILTLLALMASLMLIAAGAASARRLFRSPRGARVLNRSAGAIMVGAGTYLITR